MSPGPRIVVAGAVFSTRRILDGLLRHGAQVVGVLGLDPSAARGVSGYTPLDAVAHDHGIAFRAFSAINDPAIVDQVARWRPDVIFAVGLSQILDPPLRATARCGVVGFHPTRLPRGRGRAPLAWLVLREAQGAATFFVIDGGVDSGDILVQEPFDISDDDDAGTVAQILIQAIDTALDRWLPSLVAGEWAPIPQDAMAASWTGKRSSVDGLIDWTRSAVEIHRLVRAATRPHPGAYTHHGGATLRIWKTTLIDRPIEGVPCRVVHRDGDRPIVQTGDGLIRLDETTWDEPDTPPLRIGASLGYRTQHQIHHLRRRVADLEARIAALEDPR